jgi:hypothetical protein
MRMFGVRIGMVVVIMPMIMGMIMGMMMIYIQTTGPCAETVAELTILDIASRRRDALPLDMMMVAFLCKPNLCLKTQHLRPVFA